MIMDMIKAKSEPTNGVVKGFLERNGIETKTNDGQLLVFAVRDLVIMERHRKNVNGDAMKLIPQLRAARSEVLRLLNRIEHGENADSLRDSFFGTGQSR